MSLPRGPKPKMSAYRALVARYACEAGPRNGGSDAPRVQGLPVLPPNVELNEVETVVWQHFLEHVFDPAAHGTSDGLAFLAAVDNAVDFIEARAMRRKLGMLQKLPSGRIRIAPWVHEKARASRDLRASLAELGASPMGRVKTSSLREAPKPENEWANFE